MKEKYPLDLGLQGIPSVSRKNNCRKRFVISWKNIFANTMFHKFHQKKLFL